MTYNYAAFAVKNFVFVDLRIKAFLTKLNDYWWAEKSLQFGRKSLQFGWSCTKNSETKNWNEVNGHFATKYALLQTRRSEMRQSKNKT